MKSKMRTLFIFSMALALSMQAKAHSTDSLPALKTYRVGIFAPLYLDSIFSSETGAYRYGKGFPRFAVAGLEFVQGAQIALDSLPMLFGNIDARIYDSKSYFTPVENLISHKKLDSIDLIIGSVKDAEYFQLANFARQKNIPFLSATYPNDAGITGNPFLIIANPTLKAHCEAIYAHILQNNATDKIYLVTKPGSQESALRQNFKAINEPDGSPLLPIKTIEVADGNFTKIQALLDSNRNSIIIGGSLNEAFAGELAAYCAGISKKYRIKLMGMPNWENFKSIVNNKRTKDFPVYYSTPYFNNQTDPFSKRIKEIYLTKYKGNPSEMAYKGFETVFLFSKLLARQPLDFMSHLNEHPYKIFTDYKFKPVFLNRQPDSPDYFENKNLYMVKILNGNFSRVW